MSALRQKLLDVFAVEYREHLEAIRQVLAAIGDAPGAADLAEATRRAHSLKGAARAVGLPEVEALAHRLESLFIDTGKGVAPLDRDMRRFIADALDEIDDKASAGDAPPVAATTGRRKDDAPGPVGAGVAVTEDAEAAPLSRHPTEAPGASIRVDAQTLDRLLRSAGQLHTDMVFHTNTGSDIARLRRQLKAIETKWTKLWGEVEPGLRRERGGRGGSLTATGGEVRAALRELAGSLRAAANRHERGARSLSRHLGNLERHVKAARMLPAESVFGSFRKMVRDLAASEGREVDVVVEGLECKADRLVLQRIKDPVMHMLRNAVSHGIETAQERRAAGKAAIGSVALRISDEHGRLAITVTDDGRGIDFRKIAEKAVSEGRIAADDAAAARPDALVPLLFEPGFSTAEEVTTLSGRGVGLSVVRETVTGLQGTIDVRSLPGKGTTISLSLPVNILARRLLLVNFRGTAYALPAKSVVRVMRVAPAGLVTVSGRPAVRLADSALPLVSIGEIVGADDPAVSPGPFGVNVVIVRTGGAEVGEANGHLAVAVEGLLGVSEFVVRTLDVAASGRRRWSGVIATEDGTPCLVLNPAAFGIARIAGLPSVLRADERAQQVAKVVLVVDDSITTRTLEKSILEAHGYRVRLSVDGREALAEVRRDAPDLVISDVEMPHLDGFGLVSAMKGEQGLAAIPVILVTSRSDDVDRERGLKLGADAYVVKQKFDQTELLETIRQMV